MTAQVHGLVSPEERLLTAIEAAQEADRLERAYDVMPPHIQRRINDLRAGRVTVPVKSIKALNDELRRLHQLSRQHWADAKAKVYALRQARAANWIDQGRASFRAVQAARQDAEWACRIWCATRKRIREIERELSCRSR